MSTLTKNKSDIKKVILSDKFRKTLSHSVSMLISWGSYSDSWTTTNPEVARIVTLNPTSGEIELFSVHKKVRRNSEELTFSISEYLEKIAQNEKYQSNILLSVISLEDIEEHREYKGHDKEIKEENIVLKLYQKVLIEMLIK
ncbi:hypothetical protein BSK59_13140 [Paenibacillus odorifer]|uniref:hypothetical protein n=1 Tax=Paenibacillus odorifer TaxID=189426 RepID=UPI00096C67C1|nr:hypothetical protein [Paenibacillus odorifer]OME55417.1 hypothetical protein BSK59_13140 [Paenibacillus odorifer]